jgi:hypothetical protein
VRTRKDYVNLADGEVLRLLPLTDPDVEAHRKYLYPGGYVTMGLVNITRLVNAKLSADGYRLALLIATRVAPVSNFCHSTNESYAQELGITPNRVSRLIGQLVACRFIIRMNPRLVMVNPGWCFRGTTTQHHTAQETWHKLHPIGIVSARKKTA